MAIQASTYSARALILQLAIIALGVWPSVWAVVGYDADANWLLSSVLAFGLIGWFAVRPARAAIIQRSLFVACATLFLLLNWLLAVSFFSQATGFNDQLFFHLSADSLSVGWDTVRLLMLSQFTALSVFPFLVWFAPNLLAYALKDTALPSAQEGELPRGGVTFVALLGIVMASSFPVRDLASYLAEQQGFRGASSAAITSYVPVAKPKNIILIYAESLEATYFEQSLFSRDLLPELRVLRDQATVFENVVQRPGTGWTIAGMISSQCGFSVKVNNPFSGNTRLAATENPYASSSCMGDIAKELGYQTLFMGGADNAFAGKGNFLKAHGFDRVMGREEITALAPTRYELSPWGVHDDDLFGLALQEIEGLEASDKPYFLSLLTLDTHHPEGYPSSRCPATQTPDPMEHAIVCSDAQISDFVTTLMSRLDMENTVIAVFSDHLAMRNSLWETLRDNASERRLLFMLFDGNAPSRVTTPLSHYDIGPTILEAAAATDVRVGFGRSLALIEARVEPRSRLSSALYPEEATNLNLFASGLSFDNLTLNITVGEVSFPVSENGGAFQYGVYMLIFEDDGDFVDVLYQRDLETVRASVAGQLVAFVERTSASGESRFFIGRLSADSETGHEYKKIENLLLTPQDLQIFSD